MLHVCFWLVWRFMYDVPCYCAGSTRTHTPPICSLMIKYQRTAFDILLVEQDGSIGVTKVGYCSPHPTNACLPAFYMRKQYGIDFWE